MIETQNNNNWLKQVRHLDKLDKLDIYFSLMQT